MNKPIIRYIEEKQLKKNMFLYRTGDNVLVSIKHIESDNKIRILLFNGIIIGKKNSGLRSSIKIRKILGNEWIERIFLIHHPNIISIKIIQKNYIRKSKLYFLNKNIKKITRMRHGLKTK